MLCVCGSQLIECLRAKTTRTKTPVLAIIFRVQNTKCESIPKPPYLSGIVTYGDDQPPIRHGNFAKVYFPVLIFCFHLHLQMS
jgi:hypothetical protein